MDKIRVGLVGCGQHSTYVIHPAARMIDAFDIVACCDQDELRAEAASRHLGIPRVYKDHLTMFECEQLDAAIIATTPQNHAELVSAALNAGLQVFVEKPPAKTLEEVLELKRLSAQTGKHVMVGFMMRFRPINQHVYRIAQAMQVPPALFELSVGMGPSRSKVAGYPPALYLALSVGIHYFDLIRHFMGEVSRVVAYRHQYNDRQAAYAMLLACERGTCSFELSSCEHLGFTTPQVLGGQVNERYHLIGCGESLQLENCERLTWLKADGTREAYEPSHLALSFLEGQAYYQGGYYQELQEFADSILERRAPSVTIDDGLKATGLVFAAYESSNRGGEPIDV